MDDSGRSVASPEEATAAALRALSTRGFVGVAAALREAGRSDLAEGLQALHKKNPAPAREVRGLLEQLRTHAEETWNVFSDSRALLNFSPLPVLRDFERDDLHRIRLLFGGNRLGKSTHGLVEVARLSGGLHPYLSSGLAPPPPPGEFRVRVPAPSLGCVVCTDFKKLRNVILRKLTEDHELANIPHIRGGLIPRNAIVKWHEKWGELDLDNGSKILLMSENQQLKSFESLRLHWVLIDEEVPHELFQALWVRLTDMQGPLMWTLTALTEASAWIDEELLNPERPLAPYIGQYGGTTDDNIYFTAEQIAATFAAFDQFEAEARRTGRLIRGSKYSYVPRETITRRAEISMRLARERQIFGRFRIDAGVIGARKAFELVPDARGELTLFVDPKGVKGSSLGVGCDLAAGIEGADRSVLYARDAGAPDRRLLARLSGFPRGDEVDAVWLPVIFRLFSDAHEIVVNVERAGEGIGVVKRLLDRRLPRNVRLYVHMQPGRRLRAGAPPPLPGYPMNEESRWALVRREREAMMDLSIDQPCEMKLREHETFEVDPSSGKRKPEARRGRHDDHIFADAHTHVACDECVPMPHGREGAPKRVGIRVGDARRRRVAPGKTADALFS